MLIVQNSSKIFVKEFNVSKYAALLQNFYSSKITEAIVEHVFEGTFLTGYLLLL